MANPTTNFGWVMPTATDLVTDLPADFAVFGQGVDTSMADLLGGTTGQILSKTSATDMDFTWIANDQGDITGITATSPLTGGGSSGAITVGIQDATTSVKGSVQLSDSTSTTSSVLAATPTAVKSAYDLANGAIPKTLTTTTGDVIYASAANTPARLGVGSTGNVLTVAGGVPTWAAPAGGGKVLQVVSFSTTTVTTTTSTSLVDTNITLNITPTLNTSKVLILATPFCGMSISSSNQVGMGIALDRGGTTIFNTTSGNGEGWYFTNSYTGYHQIQQLQALSYLDSPATTSATTYKIKIQSRSSSQTSTTSVNNNTSSIILMEIGA